MVCGQLRSLGIIQTCEVLKAGLPTRVLHAALLGSSGVGGAPQQVKELMAGQPLVVRVALVLKLYDVPSDAYRVGKTRIFFKVKLE
jgi:myosin heavy subunit